MDFTFYEKLAVNLFFGFWVTIILVASSSVAGNIAAVFVAFARASERVWLRWPAYSFIMVIRGTPLLVQMFLIYYGLAQFKEIRSSFLWPILKEPMWCAFLALTISTAAYSGEVIRSGLQQVDRGQLEAAKALGLTKWQARRFIILPLALRQVLPVLSNETVLNLKASAIVLTITIHDILGAANILRAQTFRVYETLIGAALLYLLLTFVIRRGFAFVEYRLQRHQRRTAPASTPAASEATYS